MPRGRYEARGSFIPIKSSVRMPINLLYLSYLVYLIFVGVRSSGAVGKGRSCHSTAICRILPNHGSRSAMRVDRHVHQMPHMDTGGPFSNLR